MIVHCLHDELVPISKLKLHPKNRNKHPPEQVERLAKILKYQGWRYPVKVSKRSGFVTAGHGRIEAAKAAGWKQVPVNFQDYESDEQEYADLQADNAIALWAELDLSGINGDLGDLGPDFDLDLLGIKNFTLDPEQVEAQCDEDEVPEEPVEPKTRVGDIYQLGRHRLMCGDSTSIDAVERLMDGGCADITFTSPPYNAAKNDHLIGGVSGFDKKYQHHSDDMPDDDYLGLLTGFTSIAIAKSKYVFVNLQLLAHNRAPLLRYQSQFQEQVKDILIWNKKQCPPNIVKGAFNTKWEYVFCFSTDTRTRGFPCEWRGQFPNVVETESNSGNEFAEDHKAGFPVAFPSWFIEKFDFARSIYEPFCGTGTTLIAAEKFGRTCYGMELDPKYCDVIVARWEKYTGKKAELLTDPSPHVFTDGSTQHLNA
jgi:DNA modification methylase